MRVLIPIQPGTGHLNPIAPLARALLSRGHEVTFAASRSFCPRIKDQGFHAVSAGLDFVEERFSDVFPEMAGMPPEGQGLHILKTIWLDRAAKAMLPDLDRWIDSLHPDIMMHDYWEFATPLAARKRGIPYAVIAMAPHFPSQMLSMIFPTELEGLTQEAGLEPDPDFNGRHPYLYIDLYPPCLQEAPTDSLGVARRFRPWEMDHDQPAPPWLESMAERPLIYVSMGTVFNEAPELFANILKGLEHEDVNVLISLGSESSDVRLPATANSRIEPFVPQRAILDRASVFITHAGFNSLLESSAATVPMLCIPLSADQPFNAANAERVGAALTLTRMTATPENARDAVRRLLAEASFKESCRRIGTELGSLPAVENAVPLIEYLAGTREPVSTMTE